MLRRAAASASGPTHAVSASGRVHWACAQTAVRTAWTPPPKDPTTFQIARSRKPMNDAARQQLASRLREQEEREARRLERREALVAKAGNGVELDKLSAAEAAAALDAPVEEPTLEDLDTSIPMVDCAFVAELVQRRLAERDNMHLKDRDGDDAADGDGTTGVGSSGGGDAAPSKTPKWAKKESRRYGDDDEVTYTFRAPVSDDSTVITGKEVVGSTTQPAEDEAGKAKGDGDEAEEEDEPWRDEYTDGFTFIDVRTVGEVTAWGIIEGAKVLPVHDFWDAFTERDPDAFYHKYGFPQPDRGDTLLIYCQYGQRSLMAAQLAVYLGYTNVMILRDGYFEWAKQFNKLCRRFRLVDLEKGFTEKRDEEFRVIRGIGREIAPEFNEVVDEEVARLKLDTSRSRGERIIPLPPLAEKVLLEVREAQERDAKLLTDPEARAALISAYDSEYAGQPEGFVEPPLRGAKGTERLYPKTEEDKVREAMEDERKSFADKAADALGIPAATNAKARREESIGARLILANTRRRKQRLSEEERKIAEDHKELRARKRYPHKALWRTF